MSAGSPDDTAQLLLHVEKSVHRDGWDQPPFLGSLHLIRPGVLSLAAYPFEIDNPPWQFLEFIAQMLEQDALPARVFADRHDVSAPLYGLAFVSEAWMLKTEDPDEGRRVTDSGMSLADHPAAVEIRSVAAVDLTGQLYFVTRERGAKPQVHQDMEIGGRIPETLRRILLAGMKAVGNEQAVRDLSTTFIPNNEDMEASQELRRRGRQ